METWALRMCLLNGGDQREVDTAKAASTTDHMGEAIGEDWGSIAALKIRGKSARPKRVQSATLKSIILPELPDTATSASFHVSINHPLFGSTSISPRSMSAHESEEAEGASGAEAISDVLAHLHHHPQHSDELDGWTTDQLKAEILRLRRLTGSSSTPVTSLVDPVLVGTKAKRKRVSADGKRPAAEGGKKVKAARERVERDEGTGKRVEKGRRTELGKAVRAKVSCSRAHCLPSPSGFRLSLLEQLSPA